MKPSRLVLEEINTVFDFYQKIYACKDPWIRIDINSFYLSLFSTQEYITRVEIFKTLSGVVTLRDYNISDILIGIEFFEFNSSVLESLLLPRA